MRRPFLPPAYLKDACPRAHHNPCVSSMMPNLLKVQAMHHYAEFPAHPMLLSHAGAVASSPVLSDARPAFLTGSTSMEKFDCCPCWTGSSIMLKMDNSASVLRQPCLHQCHLWQHLYWPPRQHSPIFSQKIFLTFVCIQYVFSVK